MQEHTFPSSLECHSCICIIRAQEGLHLKRPPAVQSSHLLQACGPAWPAGDSSTFKILTLRHGEICCNRFCEKLKKESIQRCGLCSIVLPQLSCCNFKNINYGGLTTSMEESRRFRKEPSHWRDPLEDINLCIAETMISHESYLPPYR